jgi:pilus assembly protein CpaB
VDRNRIIAIFAIAWVSAALLSWFLYKRTKAPQQERLVAVLAANKGLPAGYLLRETDLTQVALRQQDAPAGVFPATRKSDVVNRVLLIDVSAKEPLLDQKLARRTGSEGIASTIDEGMRAVAVKIDSVSGAGELLEPGARVDVLFTKPGKMSEAITTTILQNVKLLSVGRRTRPGEKLDPKAPKLPVATLLVTPLDAQKLELAKAQGKISLVLRNPNDVANLSRSDPVTTEVLDPFALTRSNPKRGRLFNKPMTGPPLPEENPDSPDLKKKPKKKEPDPPKAVVDVFRGGKHTQEVFK